MKNYFEVLLRRLPSVVAVGLTLCGLAEAQTFKTMYNFASSSGAFPYTNNSGSGPDSGLTISGDTVYGTTAGGGSAGAGTVFAVNVDGTAFTNLHSFTANFFGGLSVTNVDGANPAGGLILSGNTLYGTAPNGGQFSGISLRGCGALFRVNTDGTGFTNIHSFNTATVDSSGRIFTNSDGGNPGSGLTLSGDTLYGAAPSYGTNGCGTIFKIKTDGSGFAILHSFAGFDGSSPSGLVLGGSTLYGTTAGGDAGTGTIFAININGLGFTNLYTFSAAVNDDSLGVPTNNDGAGPQGKLFLLGSFLYGTTGSGGISGNGTVFSINTNGQGFMNLHNFGVAFGGSRTNLDGANPGAGLILSGNALAGTTLGGGLYGNGTVFTININGKGFTTVPLLLGMGDQSYSALTLLNNTLFGTTYYGGTGGSGLEYGNGYNGGTGTVFSLTLPTEDPSLVGYWKLNEGTSATAYDFSGNANEGSITNMAWTNSPFGYAPFFDGDFSYVTVSNKPILNTTSGLTIMAWINASDWSGNRRILEKGTNDDQYLLSADFSHLEFGCAGVLPAQVTAALPSAGVWHHVAGAYDGTNMTLYVDGKLQASAPASGQINVTDSSLMIGQKPSLGFASDGFAGLMREVRLYNRGLGSSEINQVAGFVQLTINRAGTNIILTWPSDSNGFSLQSNTNIISPDWSNVSTVPVVINGQNTVTNAISGKPLFFRLSQ